MGDDTRRADTDAGEKEKEVSMIPRCPRPHCGGTIVRGEDGPVCVLCGREPGVTVRVGDMPDERKKEERRVEHVPVKYLVDDNGRSLADAIDEYVAAARRYLECRAMLVDLERRLSEARVAMADAFRAMNEARQALDTLLAREEPAKQRGFAGRRHSPETRAKIREARLAALARQRAKAETAEQVIGG